MIVRVTVELVRHFFSDGVQRAGVFCVVSGCMDRLLAEAEVDVFRTVEVVKQNRPQLVENLVSSLIGL